jgi:hypothetical protein
VNLVVFGVLAVIALGYLGVYLYTAWRSGKSRLELVTGAMDAVLVLVIVHRLAPWAGLSNLLWLVPLGLGVAAVVGAAYWWPVLPTTRPDHQRRQWITAGIHAGVVAVLLGILLWPA